MSGSRPHRGCTDRAANAGAASRCRCRHGATGAGVPSPGRRAPHHDPAGSPVTPDAARVRTTPARPRGPRLPVSPVAIATILGVDRLGLLAAGGAHRPGHLAQASPPARPTRCAAVPRTDRVGGDRIDVAATVPAASRSTGLLSPAARPLGQAACGRDPGAIRGEHRAAPDLPGILASFVEHDVLDGRVPEDLPWGRLDERQRQ